MTTILVAADLSERSDRAIERAFLVARDTGARVVLLSVVDDSLPRDLAETVLDGARNRLASHIASLDVARGIEHEVRVVAGQAHRAVLTAAAELDPLLIVMGLHRDRGFLDLFRGTTLARVARGGVWPLLVVRDHADRSYQGVLAGTDFSPPSRRAWELAGRIAPGAPRRLVHAYIVPFKGYVGIPGEIGAAPSEAEIAWYRDEAETAMKGFVRDLPGKPETIVGEGSFTAVLERAMATLKPDLIAVGGHGRAGLAHALLGSTAEDLMNDPPCDLLVCR